MQILILSQHFYPETFRINEVCIGLAQRGHAIEVLTGQPNYPEGKIYAGYRFWRFGSHPWEGMVVHRVPLVPRGGGGRLRLAVNYVTFISTATVLGSWLLRGRRFDAVFVYATSPLLQAFAALWIGRLKNAPVVIWMQDLWPESLAATGYVRSRFLLSLVRALVRFILQRTDLILVQSKSFESPMKRLAGSRPIHYVPNPAERMFECEQSANQTAMTSVFTALFAGNVGAAQAVEVLVGAAELLRDNPAIRIIVIGSGSRWEWLRSEVARLELANIELLGRLPLSEMPNWFSSADALLLTLADEPILHLTVPSKVQAYLASGRPIVASIGGESAQLIEEAGAGLVVAPGDPAALAAAIARCAAMPADERYRYGASGRAYFQKHFTMDRVLDMIEAEVQSTVEGIRT